MKSDLFLSEVVTTRETACGAIEVCALADGKFDGASSMLELRTDAYLQDTSGAQFRPDWLPHGETVREHVPHEELRELGREVFGRWVRRVRDAVPQEIGEGDIA